MASEWIECELADACASIDYGLTASASADEIGPRFLRITDIVSGHINWKTVPFVEADEETTEKYRLADGDIVLARTGASTGTSSYVQNPPLALFASYLVRLKAKPEFDSRFLAYYLKSTDFWSYIRGVLGDKSAQPNASATTMTRAPIRAPGDRGEQRAIAHILGTLDDKIDLNRRMNETLEAMVRSLFKAWFVDFEPVRAKIEGRLPAPRPGACYVYVIECNNGSHYIGQTDDIRRRWKDHKAGKVEWTKRHKPLRISHFEEFSTRKEAVKREKELKTGFGRKWLKDLIASGRARQAGWKRGQSLPGLPAHLFDLFPDRLVDSELGEIPEGWRGASLGDVVELAYGKGLKGQSRCSGSIPVYGSNGQVGWHNEALVAGPGVVVGRKGNPGTVTWVQTDFYPIDTTFYVKPKAEIQSMPYLFFALSLLGLPSLGADSAVPGLNRGMAYISKVLAAPADAVRKFDLTCAPLLATAQANTDESRTLAALRDTLLPRLISGKIRVRDAEKFASEVV